LINNFTSLKNNYNWFRFPILCKNKKEKDKLIVLAKNNNIILWNSWSWTNIVPIWSDLNKSKYKLNSCLVAEDISKKILILPNHKLLKKKDINKVIKLINNFYNKNV
jgi:dTDP-4-amino-4,6-dideoxygalactose transaminase